MAAARHQPIALMVFSSFVISIGDALVHGLGGRVGIWQILVMRGLFALPLLLLIGTTRGRSLRLHRPVWLVIRSLLMVGMWCLFYMALPTVGLALTSAGLYTFPLVLALLGWATHTQSLTRHAVIALALGFAGALLVVQPTGAAFSWTSLLPIGAAVCYALQALVTRYRCGLESPWTLALGVNLALPIAGVVALGVIALVSPATANDPSVAFLISGWHAPALHVWGITALLAIIAVTGSATMAKAYQNGDPPTIATFDYSHLLFAAVWGALFFDEQLGLLALGGMAAITCAGIMTLRQHGKTRQVNGHVFRPLRVHRRQWS